MRRHHSAKKQISWVASALRVNETLTHIHRVDVASPEKRREQSTYPYLVQALIHTPAFVCRFVASSRHLVRLLHFPLFVCARATQIFNLFFCIRYHSWWLWLSNLHPQRNTFALCTNHRKWHSGRPTHSPVSHLAISQNNFFASVPLLLQFDRVCSVRCTRFTHAFNTFNSMNLTSTRIETGLHLAKHSPWCRRRTGRQSE